VKSQNVLLYGVNGVLGLVASLVEVGLKLRPELALKEIAQETQQRPRLVKSQNVLINLKVNGVTGKWALAASLVGQGQQTVKESAYKATVLVARLVLYHA